MKKRILAALGLSLVIIALTGCGGAKGDNGGHNDPRNVAFEWSQTEDPPTFYDNNITVQGYALPAIKTEFASETTALASDNRLPINTWVKIKIRGGSSVEETSDVFLLRDASGATHVDAFNTRLDALAAQLIQNEPGIDSQMVAVVDIYYEPHP